MRLQNLVDIYGFSQHNCSNFHPKCKKSFNSQNQVRPIIFRFTRKKALQSQCFFQLYSPSASYIAKQLYSVSPSYIAFRAV